jgi:hypothetical protein
MRCRRGGSWPGGRAGARLRQDPDHRLGWRRAPARAPQPSPSRWGGHRLVVFPDRKSAEVVGLQSSPSSRSAARWPLASQSGRSRWWTARQTIPRGRVRADPRFDAVPVSMTSPRGGWCCLETTDSRTNRGQMIKGLAAEDSDRALDRLRRGRALPSWFPLDEVDLGGSHCVDRDGAQLGHSAPRCDRGQANRRRLRQLDHALGTRMASTPSTQSRSPTRGRSVGLLNQLRERALASVEDPNTTPAISSGALKDGCTVDEWDAITQGTPGSVTRSRTKRSCHSVVMDPPPGCSGPR